MNVRNRLILILTAWVVTACGGGSSAPAVAGSSPPPPPPPPPTSQAPGGLWYGTLTSDQNPVTEEYIAMTANDGRFRFVSADSDVQLHGQSQTVGMNLTGTGRAFADTGVNWLDSNHVVDTTITAIVAERDSMTGSWANASGESGTFEFFYDPLFEKVVNTNLLDSVWTGFDDLSNPEVTFTVLADGSFSGQNTNGCVSAGQFTVIDPLYNLYSIQSEITNCPIAGSYSGFAFVADFVAVNDLLAISIDDGVNTILAILER